MFPLVVKDWPHTVHLYGLSPECTSMWRSRELAELSDFPQMLHEWSAPPVSVLCCGEQTPQGSLTKRGHNLGVQTQSFI